MAALTDIREGIKTNLAALGSTMQVSAYVLASPTLPCVWVRPAPDVLIDYHEAFGNGLEWWHLIVEAYTGSQFDVGAQMKLDELVASSGTSSVKALLEADKKLGGIAQDLKVESAHGYAEYARMDGTSALGCKWNVLVYMNGN